jgi:ketosteroid isomerase-like protein
MRHAGSKRVSLPLLAILAALLAAQAFAGPPHKRESREEILALEHQWTQAQIHGDVATMDKLLSDDFVGINVTGEVVTKAQQIDRMRDRKIVITSLDLSDIKIKLLNRVAIVTSQARIATSGDESRFLNGTFRYTRVYQQLPTGAWKITSFEATRVRDTARPAAQSTPEPTPAS